MIMRHQNINKAIIIPATLFGIMIFSGCKKEYSDTRHIEAANLYSKSLKLIQNYIDSIERTNDSVEVMRISEKFDSRFTALNYEFPPDTDLKMTEEANDSIKKLLSLLVDARKKKLKELGGMVTDSIDSVESQTLADSLIKANTNQSVNTSISQSAQLK